MIVRYRYYYNHTDTILVGVYKIDWLGDRRLSFKYVDYDNTEKEILVNWLNISNLVIVSDTIHKFEKRSLESENR